MKIYNITDAPTPLLKTLQLVNVRIKVGNFRISPGGSAIVPERLLPLAQKYVRCGALAVGRVPEWYEAKRVIDRTPKPAIPPPASTPVVELTEDEELALLMAEEEENG